MSAYEMYRYIFIGGLVLAIIMAVTAILLFILLKIPKVIGDLSGSNARKAIENIRSGNEATGNKTYKSSYVNSQRGKVTDKISQSGNIQQKTTSDLKAGAMPTSRIDSGAANETTVLDVASETTVLGATDETTVLNASAETTVLSAEMPQFGETTVLDGGGFAPAASVVTTVEPSVFQVVQSIMYIHTDEIII